MRRVSVMRPSVMRTASVVGLVAAWCALWGGVSAANLLSGTLVAVVASSTGTVPTRGVVRVRPLVRFVTTVALDLAKSTFDVGREILTPTDRTEESIIEIELPAAARRHVVLMVVAITVTPGTSVVDTDPATGTLYLHLLHDDRRRATFDHVAELGRLVAAALPIDESPTAADHEGAVR